MKLTSSFNNQFQVLLLSFLQKHHIRWITSPKSGETFFFLPDLSKAKGLPANDFLTSAKGLPGQVVKYSGEKFDRIKEVYEQQHNSTLTDLTEFWAADWERTFHYMMIGNSEASRDFMQLACQMMSQAVEQEVIVESDNLEVSNEPIKVDLSDERVSKRVFEFMDRHNLRYISSNGDSPQFLLEDVDRSLEYEPDRYKETSKGLPGQAKLIKGSNLQQLWDEHFLNLFHLPTNHPEELAVADFDRFSSYLLQTNSKLARSFRHLLLSIQAEPEIKPTEIRAVPVTKGKDLKLRRNEKRELEFVH